MTLAVNTLAPYLLTALNGRPDRLIYLSSGLHHAAARSLRDIDWTERPWNAAQVYAESKLHVTALALTLAGVWPEVLSNAVDPGRVPAKMGSAAATGDLEMGYRTQTWLAVSNDAAATVSGGYWVPPAAAGARSTSRDPAFQDQGMDRLAALTRIALLASRLRPTRSGETPGSQARPPRCITPGYARPRPQRTHARKPRRSAGVCASGMANGNHTA
jgi:hypothetical protein